MNLRKILLTILTAPLGFLFCRVPELMDGDPDYLCIDGRLVGGDENAAVAEAFDRRNGRGISRPDDLLGRQWWIRVADTRNGRMEVYRLDSEGRKIVNDFCEPDMEWIDFPVGVRRIKP